MNNVEDSPAFPIVRPDGLGVQYYGMTLREYFASKADIEVYAPVDSLYRKHGRNPTINELAAWIAEVRFIEADAMLAESAK